jgi:hypothetical protein
MLKLYDSTDAVPEALRATALETKDGKFAVDEPSENADLTGLKTKNADLMTKLKAAQARAAIIGDRTPEEVQADLDLAVKFKEDKARAEGNFEQLKKQLVDQHTNELTKTTARTKKVEGKLYDVLAKREAEAAITAAGGIPKVLLPHILPFIKVTEQDDDFSAQVVDAKGNPRIADGQATPMTIAQLVEQFKADETFGVAFAASGAAGSGARNAVGAGGTGAVVISNADAKDVQKYRAAKAKAEKAGVPFMVQG